MTLDEQGVSRRAFLVGAAGLLLPRLACGQSRWDSILYWKLDDTGDAARELDGGATDPITSRTGHAIWVGSGRDRALRLDGYSVWLSHERAQLPVHANSLTIAA